MLPSLPPAALATLLAHLPIEFYPGLLHRERCPCASSILLCECRLAAHAQMERILAALSPFGFHRREHGCHRAVFLHPHGFVLKVPLGEAGRRMSRSEWELYCSASPELRRHLPVVSLVSEEHDLLLVERADVNVARFERERARIEHLAEQVGMHDVAVRNVGWAGDRLLFIDFAPPTEVAVRLGEPFEVPPEGHDYWLAL